jgi:hypothetical protein
MLKAALLPNVLLVIVAVVAALVLWTPAPLLAVLAIKVLLTQS